MRSGLPGASKAVAVLVVCTWIAGCGSNPPAETDPTPPAEPRETVQTPVEEEPDVRDETQKWVDPNIEYKDTFRNIHFAFNKYNVDGTARGTLEGIARLLKRNPDWEVLIEGHCDERGTPEYNLSLGENRAQSTKRYLVQLGVNEDRFQTISYGEERPIAFGHNDDAWGKNRRAQFRVEAPRS